MFIFLAKNLFRITKIAAEKYPRGYQCFFHRFFSRFEKFKKEVHCQFPLKTLTLVNAGVNDLFLKTFCNWLGNAGDNDFDLSPPTALLEES